ncbi:MAG: hypothetical protein ACYCO9_04485 [Streptosporangiaceae bacterium]
MPRPPAAGLGAAATDAAGAPEEEPGGAPTRPGRHRVEPTSRGRVIRPASYFRFTILPGPDLADAGPIDTGPIDTGPVDTGQAAPPERIGYPGGLIAPDWTGMPSAADSGLNHPDYLGGPADLDFFGYDDVDDRYVPAPIPPFPKPDGTTRAAWAGLFGGPAFLFIATVLGWTVPIWAELLAISAFIVGFVVLVVRLGDGPSKGDGPDQGAVV